MYHSLHFWAYYAIAAAAAAAVAAELWRSKKLLAQVSAALALLPLLLRVLTLK